MTTMADRAFDVATKMHELTPGSARPRQEEFAGVQGTATDATSTTAHYGAIVPTPPLDAAAAESFALMQGVMTARDPRVRLHPSNAGEATS